jgi:Tfp pilus assembly protein PilO
MMMPSLKTQMRWFTRIQQTLVAALVFTAIGFYALAYRPETNRLQALDGRIGQNQRELTSEQSKAKVLPQVQAEINHYTAILADFKKLPATNSDLGQFEVEMSTLSHRYNLQGWTCDLQGTPNRDGQFYELPIRVKFDGDFRDVYTFLCKMEDLSRLTRVKKLVIQSSASHDGSVQVEMLMNLYYSEG